jgi:hypothetical protein
MRFLTVDDLADWCGVIASELPTLAARARTLPAHEMVLGERLGPDQARIAALTREWCLSTRLLKS